MPNTALLSRLNDLLTEFPSVEENLTPEQLLERYEGPADPRFLVVTTADGDGDFWHELCADQDSAEAEVIRQLDEERPWSPVVVAHLNSDRTYGVELRASLTPLSVV